MDQTVMFVFATTVNDNNGCYDNKNDNSNDDSNNHSYTDYKHVYTVRKGITWNIKNLFIYLFEFYAAFSIISSYIPATVHLFMIPG